MYKRCNNCKQEKDLHKFFQAPKDASANWSWTSAFCIDCHEKGLIPYGYGWYGDKWKNPAETK